ncbi:uncharacterized protein LOC143596416 [Bidens hawaiensis]|uniref:uncharacterized protein LOC143596416 n=1 Tax=Bidens hawaiensis TaxID=980011 RepID=UPI0040498558
MDPLSSTEGAYSAVRKEMAYQGILGNVTDSSSSQNGVAEGLVTNRSNELEGQGLGFVSKGKSGNKSLNSSSSRIDKTNLKCSHCGMSKHTRDQCFKLVGYPEWWNDGHKKGNKEGTKAAGAVGSTAGKDNHQGAGFGGMAFADEEASMPLQNDDGGGRGYQDGSDNWAWH